MDCRCRHRSANRGCEPTQAQTVFPSKVGFPSQNDAPRHSLLSTFGSETFGTADLFDSLVPSGKVVRPPKPSGTLICRPDDELSAGAPDASGGAINASLGVPVAFTFGRGVSSCAFAGARTDKHTVTASGRQTRRRKMRTPKFLTPIEGCHRFALFS